MLALVVLLLAGTAKGAPVAAPTPPAPVKPADLPRAPKLDPDGAGGYRWKGPGFSALVAPDGAVRFKDDLPLGSQTTVPVRALAQAIKESTNRDPRPDPRGGPGAWPSSGGGGGGFLGALGRNALKMVTNPTLVINDEELRRDPHHAEKMGFLEQTTAFRADLRAAHDRRQQRSAQGQISQRIQAIASDPALTLAQRHQLVFDLWEECDDGQPGGVAARASIEREAGRQFPAGDSRGFTAAELARLNAGQARQTFAPYRSNESPAPSATASPTAPAGPSSSPSSATRAP